MSRTGAGLAPGCVPLAAQQKQGSLDLTQETPLRGCLCLVAGPASRMQQEEPLHPEQPTAPGREEWLPGGAQRFPPVQPLGHAEPWISVEQSVRMSLHLGGLGSSPSSAAGSGSTMMAPFLSPVPLRASVKRQQRSQVPVSARLPRDCWLTAPRRAEMGLRRQGGLGCHQPLSLSFATDVLTVGGGALSIMV